MSEEEREGGRKGGRRKGREGEGETGQEIGKKVEGVLTHAGSEETRVHQGPHHAGRAVLPSGYQTQGQQHSVPQGPLSQWDDVCYATDLPKETTQQHWL